MAYKDNVLVKWKTLRHKQVGHRMALSLLNLESVK